MDKRFFKLFDLTEEQAIAILDTPPDQVGENDSRYIAVSHLVNFSTEQSIQALMRALQQTDPSLDNRIVRRKAIETLGRLQVPQALPLIRPCLAENDKFTVENAVWAIGEIGTEDEALLAEIAELLNTPQQNYRVIIQTLAKLNYQSALEAIRPFTDYPEPPVVSAAISAICRLTGEATQMGQVVEFLHHPNVMARRLAIQDLIDARYYQVIAEIARCPVSLVFRLRAIRALAEVGIEDNTLSFTDIQADLEQTLRDHPTDLALVNAYDRPPELPFLIHELYDTDFGRCYLATQSLLQDHAEAAPEALLATYREEACADYGAHFHVVKLLGWLHYAPAYDLLVEALHNQQPQFQKSRAAAAIALGELGDRRAVDELKTCFSTRIWDLKYAALMALQQLGETSSASLAIQDEDWLVSTKAELLIK
ncbi:MAG: HEAT repeat domain-containing protein [Leptolyngbya sp. SIOISBB]|nr:HEAT repeat domain-containing protein [Leptolyngbya sp. SIOISBB]